MLKPQWKYNLLFALFRHGICNIQSIKVMTDMHCIESHSICCACKIFSTINVSVCMLHSAAEKAVPCPSHTGPETQICLLVWNWLSDNASQRNASLITD